MNLIERNRQMTEFFDRKADGYDEVHLTMMDSKTAITDVLSENDRRILDLGAGTGLELIPLFERYPSAEVTAVDISSEMLAGLARRPFAKSVRIVCADYFAADFGRDYDAVISSASLHHFDEAAKARLYAKLYACLKPGGRFINSDRFAADRAEQESLMSEYEASPELRPHMDTPLAYETERRLLLGAGFVSVMIKELDDPRYKLLIAQK